MSDNCSHNCSSCNVGDCGERTQKPDLMAKTNDMSKIKKVIGVMSGKGGVGKSLVTSLLAVSSNRSGYKTAILDADITGPSIPKAFGLNSKAGGDDNGIYPVRSKTGISVMSLNLLLANDTDPVVWRGPVIATAVKQFWSDVIWGDVDYMFIDMPPGTGDVSLTVFQSLPVDGIIVVASPQELVSMIVEKAVNMAKMMNIPILGLVENMSYFKCPDCGTEHKIFGKSRIEEEAKRFGVETVSKIPINPKLAAASDEGMIELFEGDWLDNMMEMITRKLKV
jgi:Mrp family chromosome partitioning ATPase